MEISLKKYLRILDIDRQGIFIRLSNRSAQEKLDLRNVRIRQISQRKTPDTIEDFSRTINEFHFDEKQPFFLRAADVLTIFSTEAHLFGLNLQENNSNICVCSKIQHWRTESFIKTELFLGETVIQSVNSAFLPETDVPAVFLPRPIHAPIKSIQVKNNRTFTKHCGQFPYCFNPENPSNPHTEAREDQAKRK